MLAAITATIGTFGGFLATVPLAWLVSFTGWRGALLVITAATVIGAIGTWAVVRDVPQADAGDTSVRGVVAGTMEVLRNRHTWPPFFASW